jgi:peptide deformylase
MAVPASQFGGEALLALVQDLRDTMAARDGAGLAAAPIAETVLVIPEVTPLDSELEAGEEGCLSVPGLRAAVPRWRRVRYAAFTPTGEPLVREVEGFHARMVQHECSGAPRPGTADLSLQRSATQQGPLTPR